MPEDQNKPEQQETELESKRRSYLPHLTFEDYFIGLGVLLLFLAAFVKNIDIRVTFYIFGTLIFLLEIYAHSRRGENNDRN